MGDIQAEFEIFHHLALERIVTRIKKLQDEAERKKKMYHHKTYSSTSLCSIEKEQSQRYKIARDLQPGFCCIFADKRVYLVQIIMGKEKLSALARQPQVHSIEGR